MSGLYVISNPTSLKAQFSLTRNMGTFADTLTRLSTGLRLNSGKDDPAGMIADSYLNAEITGTAQAITNTEKANSILAVADAGLGQVGSLLNDIKGLVVESANRGAMSESQIQANQLQVDASIDAIDRIARSTSFQGKRLLDGSLGFRTSCSGNNGISDLNIYSANFGNADRINVDVAVQEAARKGSLTYYGSGVSQDTTLVVSGSTGAQAFQFGAGTSNAAMAEAINAKSDSTGVQAFVDGAAGRGSVTLSSTGMNNDIVITANESGAEAGNYTFRIVKGDTEDVRIVSEPNAAKPGVVEIMVKKSYGTTYSDFEGLYNISIDSQYAEDVNLTDANGDPITAQQAQTSVTMAKGTKNAARFFTEDSLATGKTMDGKMLTVTEITDDGRMSEYNEWTIAVDDSISVDYTYGKIDHENKTIYINSANAEVDALGEALDYALGHESPGDTVLTASGGTLGNGDRITFGGGGKAGELYVTYKEGATVEEIRSLIDQTPYVEASLKSDTNGSSLVPLIGNGWSHVENSWADPDTPETINSVNPYVSGTTAQTVIELINSKLGDKFTATSLNGEGTDGRLTYMNAAVVYGDINLDNAVRFSGWDAQPSIRLVTEGPNKQLGVRTIYPTDADIANGLSTPILQISLATDASGNSITTAKELADFFDQLRPEETLGVSAEVAYPPGVDPNGRVWVTDACGNTVLKETCPPDFGAGIVQPTGYHDPCYRLQDGDLFLLGENQTREAVGQSVARITSANGVTPVEAIASNPSGSVNVSFGDTSALNKVTITFTSDDAKAGFDASSGNLTIFVDQQTRAKAGDEFDAAIKELIDGQVTHNWADIREYSQATGAPPEVQSIEYANDYTDLINIIDLDDPDGVLHIGGGTGGGGGEKDPAPGVASSPLTLTFDDNSMFEPPAVVTFTLQTATDTDLLNGVTIVIGQGVGSSWNAATKTLTTAAVPGGHDLSELLGTMKTAIDNAISNQYDAIKTATKSTETDPVQVVLTYDKEPPTPGPEDYDTTEIKGPFGVIGGGSKGGGGGDDTEGELGVGPQDAAMKITSKQQGLGMSDNQIVFLEDTNLAPGSIAVEYDEPNQRLIVTGNPGDTGRMATDELADLLNGNSTFRKYCDPIDLVYDVTPDTEVAFGKEVLSTGTFIGGYEIITAENIGNVGTDHTGTSSGIGMTGGADANERLVLQATDVGSRNYVDVSVVQGTFDTYDPLGGKACRVAGTDVVATINGLQAVADGNTISVDTADLALSMSVANQVGWSGFSINGGGMLFQLGGSVVSGQQMRIGMINASSTALGGVSGTLSQLRTGNSAAMDADTNLADRITNEAIKSVAQFRGRIGSIQRGTLDQNIVVLQDQLTAMSSAEAMLSNADFAQEVSNKVRFDLLIQAGMTVLAQANQFPQYAMSLLR